MPSVKPVPLTVHDALQRVARGAESSDVLLRWFLAGNNEHRVRRVIEAALTRTRELHTLQHMPSTLPPNLSHPSLASGPLLPWLKARAKGLKGAFDPSMLAAAVPYLGGGWQVDPTAGLLHVNGTNYDALRRLQELAGVKHGDAMQDYREGRESWWAISRETPDHLRVEIAVDVDDKGRVIVDHPVPGTLYVRAADPGQWGQGPLILWVRSPSIGVPAWAVRAPSGKTMIVLDKPRGHGDPLTADAFWKWAYAEGLAEAARGALPTTAQEEAAKRAAAVAKGLGTCGVCFGTHSLHTKSNVLVQHGYQMSGGHGHGHFGMWKGGGDCFGVGWQPFEKSPAATAAWGEECTRRAASLTESARAWQAGEHTTIHLLVTSRGAFNREIAQECSPGTLPDVRKGQRVERIGPDHPTWAERVARKVTELRAKSADYADSARWYEAAAKAWPSYPEGR